MFRRPRSGNAMEFLYGLLLILGLVLLQRILYEKLAFRRFEYRCEFSTKEAVEGEEISLVETVTNAKILPLPWLRSELVTSRWLDYAGSQSLVTDDTRFVTSFFSMWGNRRTTRSWKVRCLKRGVFPVEKCVLLTTDLVGLMSTAFPAATDAELLVLPKPADLTEVLSSARTLFGDVLVRRHYLEDPFAVAGVRERTERDPINRIHWPATARYGKLMVHNTLCTSDQNLLILLNVQSRPADAVDVDDPGRVEDCIRICAGYLEDTLRTGIPVRLAANAPSEGGMVVTEEFAGREHVLDLMRLLARLPMRVEEPFAALLDAAEEGLSASDIVLVTSFLSERMYDFARRMGERGVRVKLVCAVAADPTGIPEDCDVLLLKEGGAA